jgi:hypothetical protein
MSDVSLYELREEELLEREFREESQSTKSAKPPRVKRRARAAAYNFSGAYRRRVRKMQ